MDLELLCYKSVVVLLFMSQNSGNPSCICMRWEPSPFKAHFENLGNKMKMPHFLSKLQFLTFLHLLNPS